MGSTILIARRERYDCKLIHLVVERVVGSYIGGSAVRYRTTNLFMTLRKKVERDGGDSTEDPQKLPYVRCDERLEEL